MEDFIPAISALFIPTITYNFILARKPPKVTDRIILPIFFYTIFFCVIGLLTYSINMKRHCDKYRFYRTVKKTSMYVILIIFSFGIINYIQWPLMYWLDLFPDQWELIVTGLFLMICSQISYYMVKILTSNC